MAIFKNMHKTFKGTVGNLVGSSWKGKAVLRSRPEHVANPNTLKQQSHRLKFKMMSSFLREVQPFIELGLKSRSVGKSAHNVAMSLNLTDGFVGTFPDLAINFSEIVLSDGPIKPEKSLACTSETALTFTFTWTHSLNRTRANADDRLIVLLYQVEDKEAIFLDPGVLRSEETWDFELDSSDQGKAFHVWASFIQNDEAYCSASTYLGEITVL